MSAQQAGTDRAWLSDQVSAYKSLFPHYRAYARLLEDLLKRAAADLAPLSIVQSRPKSISSFTEKAWRKRHKYKDPVHQLTDLCGVRVICRTRSEVEAMSEFIKGNLDIDWGNSLDCSDRLKPTEFGYRSVHFIVALRSDKTDLYGVDPPGQGSGQAFPDPVEEVFGKTAEVQVRTVVEHAYADFAHDLTYKGVFELPASWKRELASAAAALEEADQTFSRIEERLSYYATNYGAYLSDEELRTEIENLEVVLEFDPENSAKAARLGKLAQMAGDWAKARRVLEPFIVVEHPEGSPRPVLRELGITYCKDYPQGSDTYTLGQRYLQMASEAESGDVDALCSLAGTWKGIDEDRVRELYRRAFEIDPRNTYALGNYLEHELLVNPGVLAAAGPLMKQAVERCRAHAQARVNLPWAFYDMGKFHLLMDEPFESLAAYARALSVSSAAFMIETSLASIERLEPVGARFKGYEWVRRLLRLGLAARFPSLERTEAIRSLATEGADPIQGPVLIVAGGTASWIEEHMRSYSGFLLKALSGFEGTVISGGTTEGISGLVGDAAQALPGRFHTIGYLPRALPDDATMDRDPARYRELRFTAGDSFSPLEPLQNWIDLLATPVAAEQVQVLGVNGGSIARAEYEIALALGARVGLIADSGREAGRILTDPLWTGSRKLLNLPADAETVQAFASWDPSKMRDVDVDAAPEADLDRERMARAIHEEYRRERMATPPAGDPALEGWESLHPALKASNRHQALHLETKLREIGCTLVEAGEGSEPAAEFTDEEVEVMARMEHGRWVVERLSNGWRAGEERSAEKKTSPYLVGWSQLPEAVKDLDRQTVRKIPRFLETVNMQVHRTS